MVDAGKRTEIMNSCIALAEGIIAKGDGMKVEEQTDNYKTQLEWQEGCPVLINTVSVDGVMVDEFKEFTANWLTNVQRLAPSNAAYTGLGLDGEHQCVFQMITPGVPLVAKRYLICTYYRKDDGDDHTFVISSVGNEHLLA